PQAVRLFDEPPLRAALASGREECATRAANDRVIAVSVSERRAVRVEHLLCGERRGGLEGVGGFADVVPHEDAAVRDRVVRNKRIKVEMREPRTVAVPLIRNPTGEVLEETKLEVDARIERPLGPAQEPALPVGVVLADRRHVPISWDVPSRTVVVPT